MRLIVNKLYVKAEETSRPGTFLGRHALNGNTYMGQESEFKSPELFEHPLIGPFHDTHQANTYFHNAGPHTENPFQHPNDLGFKPHPATGHMMAPAQMASSYADAKNTAVPGKGINYKEPEHVSATIPQHTPHFNKIMDAIEQGNGKPLLIGGFPRDHVLGKQSKDKDVEVYGMNSDQLTKLLSRYGHVNAVGASFGVIKLKTPDGEEYDFSLPRRENKEGQGHKGFQVQPDANMTPQEAASRRDFTMNSIGMDRHGNIQDFYGGINDLKNKTLRATSDKFAEDPLRVLRGMQFAGRMGLDMDPATAEMSKGLSGEYPTLSKDRVMNEWMKLAEKGTQPSKGLKVLQDTDWIKHYPELKLSPWKMETIDHMANTLQHGNFSPEDKHSLFMAALTEDMPTDNAKEFLDRVGMPLPVRQRVMALRNGLGASNHPMYGDANEANVRNTSKHVAPESIENLMHLVQAKNHGRLDEGHQAYLNTAKNLGVHQRPPTPLVNGDMLKTMGIKPGREFGQMLKDLYQAQLDGKFTTPAEGQAYFTKMLQGG